MSESKRTLLAVWIELERGNPAFFQGSELSLQASLVSDLHRHGNVITLFEGLVFEKSSCPSFEQLQPSAEQS